MKPMLAHTYNEKRYPTQSLWLQPKLNGVRALYQDGHFQSREEIPWNEAVLRHLAQPLKLMFPDERTILDGELYVHGWPLQKINGAIAVNRTEPTVETYQVQYHIFDVVSFGKTFEERFVDMMRVKWPLFTQDIPVRLVETIQCPSPMIANDFYAQTVEKGYEGIMYRIGDCPYTKPKQPVEHIVSRLKFLSDQNNRTWHLLKRKDWHDNEFKCIGVEEGQGKYRGVAGALNCVTCYNKPFSVGSGLSDQDRAVFMEHPPIGKLVKVKFLCYTSDGIPFNPTVIAVL